MKRISKKHKSKEIRAQALKQLQETREVIDKKCPDLLDKVGELVQRTQDIEQDQKNSKDAEAVSQDELVIDRHKNLETILKFIELKPHADHLKQELKTLLS